MAVSKARRISFGDLGIAPRFAYGDQARIVEVTGSGDGTLLANGFARFSDAEIPCRVKHDEVLLLLLGSVTVQTPDGDHEAGAYDCVRQPKGTELSYVSGNALVFHAILPANWMEGGT